MKKCAVKYTLFQYTLYTSIMYLKCSVFALILYLLYKKLFFCTYKDNINILNVLNCAVLGHREYELKCAFNIHLFMHANKAIKLNWRRDLQRQQTAPDPLFIYGPLLPLPSLLLPFPPKRLHSKFIENLSESPQVWMGSRCVTFGVIALTLSYWSLEVQHGTSWQRTLWGSEKKNCCST